LFVAVRRILEFRISLVLRNAAGYGAAIVALLLPLALTRSIQPSLPTLMAATVCSLAAYGSLIWTLVLTPDERVWAATLIDHRRSRPGGSVQL